jgi:hypothetical protein
MNQFSSSPDHQNLGDLTPPDINTSLAEYNIRHVVERCDIFNNALTLDTTRLYIARLLNQEGIGFTDERIEHLSNYVHFNEEEQALINQVVEGLLGRPLSTHDFTEERLAPYIAAGIERKDAEAYLLMQTRPCSEWSSSDWQISNHVTPLFSEYLEKEEERQNAEALSKARKTISEQVEALHSEPFSSRQQNNALLNIARACIYSSGTVTNFPLTAEDLHLISEGQDEILTVEQIESIRSWLISQDYSIPNALPPVLERPQQRPLLFDDEFLLGFGNEDVDLGMLDTDYADFLAKGIDPVTKQRIWDLESIKKKLSYVVNQIYRESYETGTKEFPVLIKETAISIAEDAMLTPSDRLDEINGDARKLTDEEFDKIDEWVEVRFGVKLSQFPEIIQLGIDPITLETLSKD